MKTNPTWLLFTIAVVASLALPPLAMRAMQPPPAPSATSTNTMPPADAVPTAAQAEATRPGVPPASVPPSETLGWMFTAGVLANWIMRKLKDSPSMTWIKDGAGKANVALAGALSLVSSLGIHTEFDKAAGTLLVTGLTVAGIAHFAGEWLRQWALQQWVYQTSKT